VVDFQTLVVVDVAAMGCLRTDGGIVEVFDSETLVGLDWRFDEYGGIVLLSELVDADVVELLSFRVYRDPFFDLELTIATGTAFDGMVGVGGFLSKQDGF
jgi:hypothetical protein